MSLPVVLLDTVLEELESHIASHQPERGGALVGGRIPEIITGLLPDHAAARERAFYDASNELRDDLRRLELGSPWRLLGIVHSHPSGMDHPSGHDCRSFADQIRRTPSLSRMFFPIVTRWRDLSDHHLDEHEVALPSGKLSMFCATRAAGGNVTISPIRVVVNPFLSDLAEFGRRTKLRPGKLDLLDIDGRRVLSSTLTGPGDETVLALADITYPLTPPRLLHSAAGGEAQVIDLSWSWESSVDSRVEAMCVAIRRRRGAIGRQVAAGMAARTGAAGEVARRLNVVVLGAGSVGSVLAEQLVRSGVRQLSVIDPDTVEAANLSRSVYESTDLGRPKVTALAERLARINPDAEVHGISAALADVGGAALQKLVAEADAVVGACDDPEAQALLNHLSYQAGVPGVFVMLYRAASGGEVVYTFPATNTSCYRCATAIRHRTGSGRPATDYQTGRLAGEVALGADIAAVTLAAVKVTLSVAALRRALAGTKIPTDGISDFLLGPALEGKNFVMFGTTPDFEFFPRIFAATSGQYAWQTVWMRVEPDPDCPVCGAEPIPAAALVTTPVDMSALRAAARPSAAAPATAEPTTAGATAASAVDDPTDLPDGAEPPTSTLDGVEPSVGTLDGVEPPVGASGGAEPSDGTCDGPESPAGASGGADHIAVEATTGGPADQLADPPADRETGTGAPGDGESASRGTGAGDDQHG
jgi:molybdopterin/thiamine biosynthesis adenylyltransferase